MLLLLLLVPLCSPGVPPSGDAPAVPHPALLAKAGALLLLVVLLSVGDAADGAVGGAFIGVLLWKLLLLPATFLLGQNPTEAAPQGTWWRRRERKQRVL